MRDLEGRDISDRVRLHRVHAMGVYGFLFDGELLSLGRPIGKCAVKLVHPRDRYPADGFLQDVRDQAKWAHPRLLNVHTSGVIKNGPGAGWIYMAMELGEFSLQEVLDRGDRLPQRDVQEMLLHISEALVYLHENGICHGEIRPTNIIYTMQGWKLSGLEYRGALGRRLEELGPSDNLFVFRSPETLEQLPESLPSDIWSFGVLTHAALTSRLPFQENNELTKGDLMWRITHREPEPEAVGDPFDEILAGCLKRAPLDRWSARKVHQALKGEPEAAAIPVQAEKVDDADSTTAAANLVGKTQKNPIIGSSSKIPWWALAPAAIVGLGVFLGLASAPKKVKLRPNVLSNQLTTLSFQVGRIDPRGRLTLLEARAPVIKEDLGEGMVLDLLQIPAGEFDMGSTSTEPYRETDEGPRHRVKVDAFYMARTEISQAQWAQVAAYPPVEIALTSEPSRYPGAALPVQNVSYAEATEFCRRLTAKTGRFYRLPTEAEWEYACRGGPSTEPFHFGPTLTPEVATYKASRSFLDTIPAGVDSAQPTGVLKRKCSNPFGLLEMHGNVKEWCLDYYGPYAEKRQFNPEGPADGSERVLRGGSFRSYPWKCRSADRSHAIPGEKMVDVGLRIVAPEMVPVTDK